MSINTGIQSLAAIGLFYEWAKDEGIDLDERFGTGNLLNNDEVASLAERLRLSKRKTVQTKAGLVPAPILGDSHGNRLRYLGEYVRWRGEQVVQAMPVSDPRVEPASNRLTRVVEQLSSLATKGSGDVRLGLTLEQQKRLFEVVKPGGSENPFHPGTQHRNCCLLLLYFELGLRKAEPLTLKGNDLLLSGSGMPRILITPRPDDCDDLRKMPALVKTAGRTLPVSPLLARSLDTYVMEHRRLLPEAKRTRYVFLETERGHPMSLASVYDVFRVLRRRLAADFGSRFSPHVLRHTWNDRFKAEAKKAGLSNADRRTVGNYIMGWSKTSQQDSNYGLRETEESAQKILLALQNETTGLAG